MMSELNSSTGESKLNLLDLSDDVLLVILSHLQSNDLCSLGRTCTRLQRVTSDKSLWININFKLQPSIAPFLFLYESLSLINNHTRAITLTGKDHTRKLPVRLRKESGSSSSSSEDEDYVEVKFNFDSVSSEENDSTSSKSDAIPSCSFDEFTNVLSSVKHNIDKKWLRLYLLNPLAKRSQELRTLRLQFVRLYYSTPPILPSWPSLTVLSLRGSRLLSRTASKFGPLYDLSVKLPNLVCLDIGQCAWVESHCFMAISKFRNLRTLLLDGCFNLGNCVAYTSLAACLGFPAIQELDLRDTQFGDSDLLSFKRNATISKIFLGKRMKPVRERVETFNENEEESTLFVDEPGGSGKNNKDTAGQSNGYRQGRKRRHHSEINRLGWKRTRFIANPPEALVIHVDLGLGIRVEHVHEAGEYGMSLNVDTGIGNSVTDGGIVSLGTDGLPGLTNLVLAGSGSAVTDRSLAALQKRVGLHSLDVRRTGVTESGIISFLENCPDVKLESDFDSSIVQLYTGF